MNNKRLTLIARARGSVLNLIKHTKDHPAEDCFYNALRWLNVATSHINSGASDGTAALHNAMSHMLNGRAALQMLPIRAVR